MNEEKEFHQRALELIEAYEKMIDRYEERKFHNHFETLPRIQQWRERQIYTAKAGAERIKSMYYKYIRNHESKGTITLPTDNACL